MKKVKNNIFLALLLIYSLIGYTQDAYIGQIKIFAGNFAPSGWEFCSGQLLPIAENQALFSLIGTTYGGDGQYNFALPDLRGRLVVGASGTGPGLSNVIIGQQYGTETNTMTVSQMPAHTHAIACVTGSGNQNNPTNNLYANTGLLDKEYSTTAANTQMSSTMMGLSGGNTPFTNMQPTTGLNFIICLQGIYPSQN